MVTVDINYEKIGRWTSNDTDVGSPMCSPPLFDLLAASGRISQTVLCSRVLTRSAAIWVATLALAMDDPKKWQDGPSP
jgi:hypothetical protein